MKITIVIGPYNPVPPLLGGAVERIHCTLASQFAARGHNVTMISRQFGNLASEETTGDIRHIRVPSHNAPTSAILYKLYDLTYSCRVARILPSSDVTITNSLFLPIVLPRDRSGHIYVHAARFPKGQMRFYKRASRIQTVSQVVADEICRQTPAVSDRVISIPNPLSGPMALLALPDRQPRERVILYVGRIAREKGIHHLVNAFTRGADGPLAGYRLRIIGPHEIHQQGDGQAYLRELEALAGPASNRVSFEGPMFDPTRLREIFLSSDIFVYPSIAEKGETFGVAPLEAMAARCRVVVSRLACFQEFVEPGRNAMVFDHRTDAVENLLATLSDLVRHGDDSAMRANAVDTASRFQPAHIADLYLKDFESLTCQGILRDLEEDLALS